MLKPGGGGRAGKLFEVFYAGDKGTLYFIKPLEFRSGDARLWMDYTFHYRPDSSSDALVNFTIRDTKLYRSMDSVSLQSFTLKAPINSIRLLYNEKQKSGFVSRFSGRLPMITLYNYLEATDQTIFTYRGEYHSMWRAAPKTERKIHSLQENLLILMAPDTAAMAEPPAGNR